LELRDLIVTPTIILLVYAVAYIIRPWLTDDINRVYFFPALTLKIIGAIALGFIYQFYYGGGDTYSYHTSGSRHIWEAIMDSPSDGFKLLLVDGTNPPPKGTYDFASRIIFFHDPSSYFVVRVSALFDLLTFSSYSATGVLFAAFSFFGMWLFFLAFYEAYPDLHRWIAVAAFFIPSVFFWGSGLLKDTITLACLAAMTYAVVKIFIHRQINVKYIILLLICMYVIYGVKKYILLCYLPAMMMWVFGGHFTRIRSMVIKIMLVPFVIVGIVAIGYLAVVKIGEDDPRYSLDKIAITARITAYDIGFYTGKDAGSGYSLGELDGTFSGMVKLAPQAVNVSLFRPYLWEVRNPLMLLSALESFAFLVLTVYALFRSRKVLGKAAGDPTILFCFVFSVTFAFAVGISTFNFGTLTRYKIPLLPFYLMGLVLLLDYSSNKETMEEDVDVTE
jgi:hypothetical protein